MKYYIATKLENDKEHNRLRDYLSALGHQCTYDWTVHGPVWSLGTQRCIEVAKLEAEGVAKAEIVIAMWPAGRGTHVELGIALGLRKTIIFFSEEKAHHDAYPELCVFYLHPEIVRVKSKHELYAKCKELMGDRRSI